MTTTQEVQIDVSAFGSDAIAYLCAKYDKDKNGKFDVDECARAAASGALAAFRPLAVLPW